MVGRTNALVRPLVSSVNGMTGTVILNANIIYDPSTEYDDGTLGAALQNFLTKEQIDSLFPVEDIVIPNIEDNSGSGDSPIPEEPVEDQSEEEEGT